MYKGAVQLFLFDLRTRKLAGEIARLVYTNPFVPERIRRERAVLGREFDEKRADWNLHPDWKVPPPNVARLAARAEELAERARRRLAEGAEFGVGEREIYEDLALFVLYYRHRPALQAMLGGGGDGADEQTAHTWDVFAASARSFFGFPVIGMPDDEIAHLFACCAQIVRAFDNVFQWIIGVSRPAVELRAAVWQSIFTHDMRRYRRVLFSRMGDYATLVTGPSGTGKELVARAVGLSRYVPFDSRRKAFVGAADVSFHALNLSAMSTTLIESELFGHKRGAFTGAVSDRKGWLETCPRRGSVFLDEIGEIDPAVQVKLLRVLEDRTFSRVGDTAERHFLGKIIAATNRDLAEEMREGRFRTDLYYRMCSDIVTTPSLADRIGDSDEERRHLLGYLARRLVDEEDAESLAREVGSWIDKNLGRDYAWPGNVRELEQCVRNIVIRSEYRPAVAPRPERADPARALADRIHRGELSADDLLREYCTLVYARTGTFEKAAQVLKLDRRTVRAKITPSDFERS